MAEKYGSRNHSWLPKLILASLTYPDKSLSYNVIKHVGPIHPDSDIPVQCTMHVLHCIDELFCLFVLISICIPSYLQRTNASQPASSSSQLAVASQPASSSQQQPQPSSQPASSQQHVYIYIYIFIYTYIEKYIYQYMYICIDV